MSATSRSRWASSRGWSSPQPRRGGTRRAAELSAATRRSTTHRLPCGTGARRSSRSPFRLRSGWARSPPHFNTGTELRIRRPRTARSRRRTPGTQVGGSSTTTPSRDILSPVHGWIPYVPVHWLGLAALGCLILRFGWPAAGVPRGRRRLRAGSGERGSERRLGPPGAVPDPVLAADSDPDRGRCSSTCAWSRILSSRSWSRHSSSASRPRATTTGCIRSTTGRESSACGASRTVPDPAPSSSAVVVRARPRPVPARTRELSRTDWSSPRRAETSPASSSGGPTACSRKARTGRLPARGQRRARPDTHVATIEVAGVAAREGLREQGRHRRRVEAAHAHRHPAWTSRCPAAI